MKALDLHDRRDIIEFITLFSPQNISNLFRYNPLNESKITKTFQINKSKQEDSCFVLLRQSPVAIQQTNSKMTDRIDMK